MAWSGQAVAAVAGPRLSEGLGRARADRPSRRAGTAHVAMRRYGSVLRRRAEVGLQRLVQGGGRRTDWRPPEACVAAETLGLAK